MSVMGVNTKQTKQLPPPPHHPLHRNLHYPRPHHSLALHHHHGVAGPPVDLNLLLLEASITHHPLAQVQRCFYSRPAYQSLIQSHSLRSATLWDCKMIQYSVMLEVHFLDHCLGSGDQTQVYVWQGKLRVLFESGDQSLQTKGFALAWEYWMNETAIVFSLFIDAL